MQVGYWLDHGNRCGLERLGQRVVTERSKHGRREQPGQFDSGRRTPLRDGPREQGERAVLLYAVLRADCDRVVVADAIDPAYGEALRAASRAGVEIIALGARVTARAITVERTLPVML